MFGLEKELIVSEGFESYIDTIVGQIDCGPEPLVNIELVGIESERVQSARNAIIFYYLRKYLEDMKDLRNVRKQLLLQTIDSNKELEEVSFEKLIIHASLGFTNIAMGKVSDLMTSTHESYNELLESSSDSEEFISLRNTRLEYTSYYDRLSELAIESRANVDRLNNGSNTLFNPNTDYVTNKTVFKSASKRR